jgi:PAS domain S-box-containing protein
LDEGAELFCYFGAPQLALERLRCRNEFPNTALKETRMSPQHRIILIVDDAPEDRALCRRSLRHDSGWDYAILEVDSGERALEICRETRPDCILLDYRLPDMDGLEVLAVLADEAGEVDLPVVMLTGADEVSLAVESMKAGAQDFINKSRLTPIDLRRAVHNAIVRVALRREVREKELRFRTLTEAIPQLVWTSAADGRCDYLSSRWAEFTGEPIERRLGHGWFDSLHPDDIERARDEWARAVASGSDYDIEFRLRRADGVFRWHLARAVPFKDADGRVTNWFGACTDIEDRKQSEQEREQALLREQQLREQAETASRLKDEFLAAVSHELRTPLNSISGWTERLRSENLSAEQSARALEIIERNANSQKQLINDLLEASSNIAGKTRLNIGPVRIGSVIAAAVETVRPSAAAKEIRLSMSLDPSAEKVSGDAERLQQVMWNLLSNAVKYTPKGGHVEVRLERVNTHIEISVADNGQGIKPEFLPHVFDHFRQEDGGISRRHGGLGLGLAIVRHLVELHGGTVHASSSGVGHGATFTVALPAVSAPAVIPDERRVETPDRNLQVEKPPSLSGVRLLVVEDDADGRDLVVTMLTQSGAEVRAAGSAAEALAALDRWRPDAIISDIGLPGEDGYMLMEKLRTRERERGVSPLPAIALTAYTRMEDRRRAFSAGYQSHISKPVVRAELLAVVAGLINQAG